MAKHTPRTVETLRKTEFAALYILDDGGTRIVLAPPLPGLQIPPSHAREAELRALAAIADDEAFEDAVREAVGRKP